MAKQMQMDDVATATQDNISSSDGMTRADAGSLGGQTTKERYGKTGFYREIGRKGGKARGKNR